MELLYNKWFLYVCKGWTSRTSQQHLTGEAGTLNNDCFPEQTASSRADYGADANFSANDGEVEKTSRLAMETFIYLFTVYIF